MVFVNIQPQWGIVLKSIHLKILISILLLAIAHTGIAQGTGPLPNLQPSEQECLDSVQRAQALPPEVVDTSRGDTFYRFQWHLSGTATAHQRRGNDLNENSTTRSIHINVEKAWEKGYRGEGTYIAIVDSEIDFNHPDLKPNLATECSYDYNNKNVPRKHGVIVSGTAAARGYNGIGVRGVAPLAKFFLLGGGGGTSRDSNNRYVRNDQITAVSNHSYGAGAFGYRSMMRFMAMETGVREGFYGKGTVYVWSAGNRGDSGDNSNYDTYKNYHTSVTVCGVDYQGRHNGGSEPGANLWLCTPNSDADDPYIDYQIFTTDIKSHPTDVSANYGGGLYTSLGSGTSLSAPMVSGVVALMRQANPNLGWRDVKLILAASAVHNDPEDSDWKPTGIRYGAFADDPDGRYRFNHKYGFGLVDAYQAVRMAEDWINLPPQATAAEAQRQVDANGTQVESSLSIQSDMDFIEHVEPTINFSINRWRNLIIELISPAGTISTLARSYTDETSIHGDSGHNGAWRFGSSKHLGEAPSGTWRLIARNTAGRMITLRDWKLKIRGYQVQLDAVASEELSYLEGKTAVQLTLAGAHWKQQLSVDDFRLSNAPPGLSIENVVRATTTHAELILDLSDDLADDEYLFQVIATTGTVSNLTTPLVSNDLEIVRIALSKVHNKGTIPSGKVGSNYRIAGAEILSSPTTLSYSISLIDEMQNELPHEDLGFSIADGVLHGTPTQVGQYQVRITATRADGMSREETFTFAVGPLIIYTQVRVYLEGLLR